MIQSDRLTLRQATAADLPEMRRLYAETIMNVCQNEYDEQQRAVWSSTAEREERWQELIERQWVVVAVKDALITGFSSLHEGNYIDFMYVHKDYQRQGIADALLAAVEAQAGKGGAAQLTSDISKTAKPFFEKKGYVVLKEQVNLRQGVELINYKMMKEL